MASYKDYLKQIEQANSAQKAADIAASNALYDNQIKAVNEQYDQQIADTTSQYDLAQRKNDVQKIINERAVARRNAELGLTDSGKNLTGQLAVQLSHSNQRGNIEMQKQKAVDTLAATMRAQISELNMNKSAAANQITSSYKSSASEQAAKMYEADVGDKESAKEKLIKALLSETYSDEIKRQMILDFDFKYLGGGQEEIDELNALLNYAGLSYTYYIDGKDPIKPNGKGATR